MIQSMVYKGDRSPTTIFSQLLEDIISIADFVNLPKNKAVLKNLVGLILYQEEEVQRIFEPKIPDEILPRKSSKKRKNNNNLSLA